MIKTKYFSNRPGMNYCFGAAVANLLLEAHGDRENAERFFESFERHRLWGPESGLIHLALSTIPLNEIIGDEYRPQLKITGGTKAKQVYKRQITRGISPDLWTQVEEEQTKGKILFTRDTNGFKKPPVAIFVNKTENTRGHCLVSLTGGTLVDGEERYQGYVEDESILGILSLKKEL